MPAMRLLRSWTSWLKPSTCTLGPASGASRGYCVRVPEIRGAGISQCSAVKAVTAFTMPAAKLGILAMALQAPHRTPATAQLQLLLPAHSHYSPLLCKSARSTALSSSPDAELGVVR